MALTSSGGVVTVIGDSQFWCHGLARTDSWPYQLAKALAGGLTPTLDTLTPWSNWVESGVPTTGANRAHVAGGFTVRNAGVDGNTTRAMRSRFATDVLGPTVKPDVCLIGGPVNDLYLIDTPNNDPTYALNYSPGGIKENVAWMIGQCQANGIVPILTTCQPWGGIESGFATRWQQTQDYLKWIGSAMSWMSSSETPNAYGLQLIDLYALMYDPAHPAYFNAYPTGAPNSGDGNHPSAAACLTLAGAIKSALLPATLTPATEVDAAQPLSFSLRTSGLTLDPDPYWQQSGTALTVHGAVGRRREVTGVVTSATGGPCSFRGADAADFEVSLNGTDWAPSVTVPAGDTPVWLSAQPSAAGAIAAEIGIPA